MTSVCRGQKNAKSLKIKKNHEENKTKKKNCRKNRSTIMRGNHSDLKRQLMCTWLTCHALKVGIFLRPNRIVNERAASNYITMAYQNHANLSNNLVCEDGPKIVAFCFVVTFYYDYCLEWWLRWRNWKNRNYGDNSLNDLQRRHVKQYITYLPLFLAPASLYKHAACISLPKAFKRLICRTDGKMNFVASVCQLFVRVFIVLYCIVGVFFFLIISFCVISFLNDCLSQVLLPETSAKRWR